MSHKIIFNTVCAITLISVLLAGSFLGPIPFADASHRDNCKEKKKYNGICDLKRPDLKIDFPKKRDHVPSGEITIRGTASDEISGIKNVKVKINRDNFKLATLTGGDNWEFTTELDPGFYFVVVKATDNVNNKKFKFTFFFVEP